MGTAQYSPKLQTIRVLGIWAEKQKFVIFSFGVNLGKNPHTPFDGAPRGEVGVRFKP